MKEFLVAADRTDDNDKPPVEFQLRDPDRTDEVTDEVIEGEVRTLTAYYPGDGQFAAFMATNASFSSLPEKVAGVVNFFVSVLDENDHSYIVSRLFDRHDPFGTKHMMDILQFLVEEWTGKAPASLPASTAQQQRPGRKSTRATPALT